MQYQRSKEDTQSFKKAIEALKKIKYIGASEKGNSINVENGKLTFYSV